MSVSARPGQRAYCLVMPNGALWLTTVATNRQASWERAQRAVPSLLARVDWKEALRREGWRCVPLRIEVEE